MRRGLALKPERREDENPLPTIGFSGTPLSDLTVALDLLIIMTLVFLTYMNTLGFTFVHDDNFQIVGNTWLGSWEYLPRYFTRDVWAFEHSNYHGTFYRPIFLLWLRLQYLVFGLSPWGWHLCTVYCHVGVTLLVYYTAARLLKDRLAEIFATLKFGLHPTHAEAVAWARASPNPYSRYFCSLPTSITSRNEPRPRMHEPVWRHRWYCARWPVPRRRRRSSFR